MKTLVIITALLSSVFPLSAQSWEQVKNSREYLYGEGSGATVAEADKQALNDLISKISLQISSATTQNESEINANNRIDSETTFVSSITTYSQATLHNTEKVIIQNEPDAIVGRWIRRADLNKIFESRKDKIRDYVSSALKAKEKGKIDIALKGFYWALSLTKSLQVPNEMSFVNEDGEKFMLMTWIPAQIDEMLENVDANVIKRENDEVELLITYLKKPVNSIDYTYFDGRDWSNIYSAKDGVGVLELAPGNKASSFNLKFEYEYMGESRIDTEVETVLRSLPASPIRSAYKTVKGGSGDLSKVFNNTSAAASFSNVPQSIFKKPEEFTANQSLKDMMSDVVASITKKQYDAVASYFTPDGFEIYKRLIAYGKAVIVGKPDIRFYRSGPELIVRGVQMSFSFKSGIRKSFVEDVVFTLNGDNKIDNVSFGLGKTAEDDILGKGVWAENARFAIMNFLENYQTAYALKRLDYIETIFDDDAVIITGKVVKVPAKRLNSDFKGIQFANDIIKYNRHTKDSYLKQLKKSFDSNDFINIRFADNEVRKLGKGGELYAIQISQEYCSPSYGDKGYLFLMVDINDPKSPIIKVRTWQPEKDPDFGLYGPEDFQ